MAKRPSQDCRFGIAACALDTGKTRLHLQTLGRLRAGKAEGMEQVTRGRGDTVTRRDRKTKIREQRSEVKPQKTEARRQLAAGRKHLGDRN